MNMVMNIMKRKSDDYPYCIDIGYWGLKGLPHDIDELVYYCGRVDLQNIIDDEQRMYKMENRFRRTKRLVNASKRIGMFLIQAYLTMIPKDEFQGRYRQ